jgi:hypothetical protein
VKQRSEAQDRHEQMFGQGEHSKPTRAPLQRREASPDKYTTSGMERALGGLADKEHQVK